MNTVRIWTAALCVAALSGGAPVGAQDVSVRFTQTAERTFALRMGDYEVVYGPEQGRRLGAGLAIYRTSSPDAAIFTRMAHGPSFNVTDYGTFVGYEHKTPKKDFAMFRGCFAGR